MLKRMEGIMSRLSRSVRGLIRGRMEGVKRVVVRTFR